MNDVTGVDTSDLTAKRHFLLWKRKLTKQILKYWLMFKNLKSKVDDLDAEKLKTVDLKKKSDAVGNEILENTKLNKLNTKVNNQIN